MRRLFIDIAVLVLIISSIAACSNEDESKVTRYPVKQISCKDISLSEDINCIFNKAFVDMKVEGSAVVDSYYVQKYNQTSITLKLKPGIDKETVFTHFKNAMNVAVKEDALKEFTVDIKDENNEVIDGYSFIGDDNVKEYNWKTVKWNEVSIYGKK